MIKNIHKNCLGTASFSAKFPRMRKWQEFIVYPLNEAGAIITVQSDSRFGKIDLDGGEVELSANHSGGAYSHHLVLDRVKKKAINFELPRENVDALRQWVKSTGGVLVGGDIVKTENIGAMAL